MPGSDNATPPQPPLAEGGLARLQQEPATPSCHLCGAELDPVDGGGDLLTVSSDCRPGPRGLRLAFCRSCGTLQKPVDDDWRRDVAAIYDGYDIYHQSGGVEQAVFATGDAPAARSERLIDCLAARFPLASRGRMLDVGCGNGALLRAFARRYRSWTLCGTELDDRHRDEVLAIDGVETMHCGPPAQLAGRFDLVTMVHVLEHVIDPVPFLRSLAPRLDGGLLVEVPDHARNPFDLLIADHCTHFTARSLVETARRAGYLATSVATDWIAKELSLVVSVASAEGVVEQTQEEAGTPEVVARQLRWLSSLAAWATDQVERTDAGLFGTSIAATWLAATLDDRVGFYVDEDPSRAGRPFRGRPVLHPRDVPEGATVLVIQPPDLAGPIAARLNYTPPPK